MKPIIFILFCIFNTAVYAGQVNKETSLDNDLKVADEKLETDESFRNWYDNLATPEEKQKYDKVRKVILVWNQLPDFVQGFIRKKYSKVKVKVINDYENKLSVEEKGNLDKFLKDVKKYSMMDKTQYEELKTNLKDMKNEDVQNEVQNWVAGLSPEEQEEIKAKKAEVEGIKDNLDYADMRHQFEMRLLSEYRKERSRISGFGF